MFIGQEEKNFILFYFSNLIFILKHQEPEV